MTTPGIRVRHRRGCGTKEGGECTCSPGYEAFVWGDGKKERRTFATLAEAEEWRAEHGRTVAAERERRRAEKKQERKQERVRLRDRLAQAILPRRAQPPVVDPATVDFGELEWDEPGDEPLLVVQAAPEDEQDEQPPAADPDELDWAEGEPEQETHPLDEAMLGLLADDDWTQPSMINAWRDPNWQPIEEAQLLKRQRARRRLGRT